MVALSCGVLDGSMRCGAVPDGGNHPVRGCNADRIETGYNHVCPALPLVAVIMQVAVVVASCPVADALVV